MSMKDPVVTIRLRDKATPVVYQRPCDDHKAAPDSVATANDKAMPVVYQRPCRDHKATPDSAMTANDEAAPVVY